MAILTNSELAHVLLELEGIYKKARVLESMVRETVLALGKSQRVGDVEARYSKGRTTYDYESAARSNIDSMKLTLMLPLVTKHVIDWKRLCDENEEVKEVKILKQGAPTVNIKLVENAGGQSV